VVSRSLIVVKENLVAITENLLMILNLVFLFCGRVGCSINKKERAFKALSYY
jgi:hypothetical protein